MSTQNDHTIGGEGSAKAVLDVSTIRGRRRSPSVRQVATTSYLDGIADAGAVHLGPWRQPRSAHTARRSCGTAIEHRLRPAAVRPESTRVDDQGADVALYQFIEVNPANEFYDYTVDGAREHRRLAHCRSSTRRWSSTHMKTMTVSGNDAGYPRAMS
jgi:hypothetical protein